MGSVPCGVQGHTGPVVAVVSVELKGGVAAELEEGGDDFLQETLAEMGGGPRAWLEGVA